MRAISELGDSGNSGTLRSSADAARGHARVAVRSRVAPSPTLSGLMLLALSLAAALLIVATAGCDRSPTAPDGDLTLNFETVVKTTLPNTFPTQIRRPIRDEAELAAVWSELWGGRGPAQPAVDFGREMIVVATARDACFGDITIEGLGIDRGTLEIAVAEPNPGVLCLCVAAEFTFHVVRAQRVDLPERFSSRIVPSRCGG